MGLKWQYEMALNSSDSVSTFSPHFEKHWDSNAFHSFIPSDTDYPKGQIVYNSHEKTKYGIKLDSLSVLPGVNENPTVDDGVRIFETAILLMIAGGSAVGVITLPEWLPVSFLVQVLGEVARRAIWNRHPESELLNLRFICPTQEIFDGVDKYFQGTWELS